MAGAGSAAGVVILGPRAAGASPDVAPVTLWRLDPDWGTPLRTSTGRMKTRCKGRACHDAAPNRFFLSRSDALAGRLHACCLAQPEPVEVRLDIADIRLWYRAAGGVLDRRSRRLPPEVRRALHTTVVEAEPPAVDRDPAGGAAGQAGAGGPASGSLAYTGFGGRTLATAGVALVAGGVLAKIIARRQDARPAPLETRPVPVDDPQEDGPGP